MSEARTSVQPKVGQNSTKYVFVTGGVVSSLGKGITAASLGRLLKARGLKVQVQKFDPYLNVDPGTMSPFQHGEVFVTEDGAETDLDIGHYERFVDENLSKAANHTAGGVWDHVLPPGAQGRVPRLDRAGDPARHQRDQAAHPLGRRAHRHGRRHLGDRRHRRRHRVAAVPRGDPPVPPRSGAGERALPPRHARALHRDGGRAEDEADAALGQRAAPHRYPPRHRRLPVDRGPRHGDPRQDRALRRRRSRGGRDGDRRAGRLPRAEGAAGAGARPARLRAARPACRRGRARRVGRARRAAGPARHHASRSRSSAST